MQNNSSSTQTPTNAATGPSAELVQTVNAAVRQALAEYGLHRGTPAPAEPPFIEFKELQRRLPMYGERSLRTLITSGKIPAVRPPGTRKIALFWPHVERALLRCTTGPVE